MRNLVFSTGEDLEIGSCYSFRGIHGVEFFQICSLSYDMSEHSVEFWVFNFQERDTHKQSLHWHPYKDLRVLDKMFVYRECTTCPNFLTCTLQGMPKALQATP